MIHGTEGQPREATNLPFIELDVQKVRQFRPVNQLLERLESKFSNDRLMSCATLFGRESTFTGSHVIPHGTICIRLLAVVDPNPFQFRIPTVGLGPCKCTPIHHAFCTFLARIPGYKCIVRGLLVIVDSLELLAILGKSICRN